MVNRVLLASWAISADLAHRLPIALVLMQAIVCVVITLSMVEPKKERHGSMWDTCGSAVKLTLSTAKWVFTNPATLVIVVIGLSIDCVVRNFATITSSYYRLIELPEWSFGFIGAGLGLLGYAVPTIAAKLNKRFGTLANFGIIACIALIGLVGIVPADSHWGLLPAMLLMTTLGYLGFTISRALNRETDSARRATVLSVKGLAFNLAYGSFSLGFSLLLASFRQESAGEDLRGALFWQVPFFAITVFGLLWWGKRKLRSVKEA